MVTTTVRRGKEKEEEEEGCMVKRYPTSKTYNFNPHRCSELTCMNQRLWVDEKYSHLKYREKFEFLNRCMNCSTFYQNELRVCPCCRKGLRFRPKKHNKRKGYDNDSDFIGY